MTQRRLSTVPRLVLGVGLLGFLASGCGLSSSGSITDPNVDCNTDPPPPECRDPGTDLLVPNGKKELSAPPDRGS